MSPILTAFLKLTTYLHMMVFNAYLSIRDNLGFDLRTTDPSSQLI